MAKEPGGTEIITLVGAVLFFCLLLLSVKGNDAILLIAAAAAGAITLIRCRSHLRNWLKGLGGGPVREAVTGSSLGLLVGSILLLTDYKSQTDITMAIGVVALAAGVFLAASYFIKKQSSTAESI